MPMKTPKPETPPIRKELLDELLAQYKTPSDLTGPGGLLQQLTGALIQRALQEEMAHHLGYAEGQAKPEDQPNSRNGASDKTVLTDNGPIPLRIPRDRDGSFVPQIVPKHKRRLDDFNERILFLYSQGLSDRDIAEQIRAFYHADVSPDLISAVTDGVLDEMRAWRARPLAPLYCLLYLDCLFVKIRVNGVVSAQAVYVVQGVTVEGHKEVLGLWISPTEGAKFWREVLTELKNRGVKDVLIACCDGLAGFPEALEAVFPRVVVQTCVVHQIRNSLAVVAWQERKKVAADLRPIYQAPTADAGLLALDAFEQKWGKKYPSIARSWLNHWDTLSPFFAFPPAIRKVIYTTNAMESLNRQLRKILKTKGALPTETAAYKILYLAIRRIEAKRTMALPYWKEAIQQFALIFEGRVTL